MPVPTVQLPSGQTVHLGRIIPTQAFDWGPFRIRDYPDGTRTATLRLGAYYDIAQDTAPPPDSTNWRNAPGVSASLTQMYKNDQLGDCVIASKYHSVGLWTANETGTAVLGTDAEVVAAYHSICGPGDNGCNIGTVLDAMKVGKLKFNGVVHLIDDYVAVDNTNKNLVQVAIEIFATGPLGIDLPFAWTSGGDGSVWDVTNTSVGGGHDVPMIDYDQKGVWISTWGGTRLITWPAFMSKKWITEADIMLSPDWYSKGNVAPNGISADRLKADLALIASGTIPSIDPPTPPIIDWNAQI